LLAMGNSIQIKYFGKKFSLENKCNICDENRVVVLQAITKKVLNPNAPKLLWSFKYEPKCKVLNESL
jgi:hypothetical protein